MRNASLYIAQPAKQASIVSGQRPSSGSRVERSDAGVSVSEGGASAEQRVLRAAQNGPRG